jgi:hypothetical protein
MAFENEKLLGTSLLDVRLMLALPAVVVVV